MKKIELILKSREAMLSAVQIYNNPQILFKSETYITLAIISWTYLLHVYYANNQVDYRYYTIHGKRKYYDKTKCGAFKHWELERCLNDKKCPFDLDTINNLKFLIGIRHEIEHQMTDKIDNTISAKILACSLNYNYYIKDLFGDEYGLDKELSLAIQFSPISPSQKDISLNNDKNAKNIQTFISEYESTLSDNDISNPRYAYRLLFTPLSTNRRGQADKVIEFVKEGTKDSEELNKTYTIIKETEKKKYTGKEIVNLMKQKGYSWFTMNKMTDYWKNVLGSRENYGIRLAYSWMWYENWISIIEKYCKENNEKYSIEDER